MMMTNTTMVRLGLVGAVALGGLVALAENLVSDTPSTGPDIRCTRVVQNNVANHGEVAKAKSFLVLGDSISDRHHIGCTKNYWGFLAERYGVTPFVYAINGQQMRHIPDQAAAFLKEHPGEKPDVVLIFAGTNDYNGNAPLGEWYSFTNAVVNANGNEVTRRHRSFLFDKNTFRGRINLAISFVREHFPEAWIVMLTPVHRGYANFGPKNVQPDESYANGRGLFLDAYVDAVKEAGNVWAVKVVDLHAVSGIFPNSPTQDAWISNPKTDRLHPSTQGHKRMADAIAREIGGLFQ